MNRNQLDALRQVSLLCEVADWLGPGEHRKMLLGILAEKNVELTLLLTEVE